MSTDDSSLDDPVRQLQLARARAIEKYADVEQALCELFAYLLGTERPLAGIVFFRIVNTRARNAILKSLLRKKFGSEFEAYWNGQPNTPNRKGLFNLINHLDQKRNEIVHWAVAVVINSDDPEAPRACKLTPPNFWDPASRTTEITLPDLIGIREKADFVSKSIFHFAVIQSGALPRFGPRYDAWLRIFQKPCIYPPPDIHPLSPNYKEPETPPQS